jgi:hypothetical protein
MKLKLKVMDAFCELEEFEINGISADYEDFGKKYDADKDAAEPYGCGDMSFFPKSVEIYVLDKYKITKDEYKEICKKLEEALSFGSCGWCV